MSGSALNSRARLNTMLHRYPLLALTTGMALGILLDANLQKHAIFGRTSIGTLVWIVSFVLFGLVLWKSPPRWRLIVTVLLLMPIAAIRYEIVDADHRIASVLQIVSDEPAPAVIEGRIDRPVVLRRHPLADQMARRDQSPWQTVAELRISSARVGQRQQPFGGRALVVIDGKMDELLPGDQVRAFGWASRFSGPTNPGERDLRDVYRQRGLHIRVNVDSPQQLRRTKSDSNGIVSNFHPLLILYRGIANFARHSRDILLRHTDAKNGPLAVALVIGQRDFVDPRMRDQLLVTGTAHLLSVSGLHLAIIAMMASQVAMILRATPFVTVLSVLFACVVYTAITGGRPPVVRACMLVAMLTLSFVIMRPSQPLNSLAMAAIVLLFINPELLFSIGVQLSFLAVTTLLMCGRRYKGNAAQRELHHQQQRLDELVQEARSRWIRAMRDASRLIGQMFWFSGCVTAVAMPLVWYQFHVISPISVIANVVLWPFLVASLAAGVATVLAGWFSDFLAIVPGWICNLSVSAMRWVIETAAAVPSGHFWFPAPPAIWVVTFYVVLLALMWWRPRASGLAIRCGWIVIWTPFALLISTRPSDLPTDTIEATFVNVGHGTCAVLRLDADDVWLYDCGRLGNDTGSSRDIDVTLWTMGITRLSGIILSHADSDHYNALPGVIRRFGVGRIITPPGMLREEEPGLDEIRRSIAATGVPVEEVGVGDVIISGDRQMSVLHPPQDRIAGSDNANSLVLRIDQGDKSLILPGDLEPPGTVVLVEQDRPPPGGVLMAPHHGSLRMDAATVLHWARPSETIVSGGERAKRPEVKEMLSAAGSGVYVTAHQGAVRVRIDDSGAIQTETWNTTPWPAR